VQWTEISGIRCPNEAEIGLKVERRGKRKIKTAHGVEKMKRIYPFMAAFAGFVLLSGCASWQQESLSDQNWGRSYETAKYNQMLNPEAGKNLKPVEGLSGVASENSIETYEKSFKEKPKQENTTILKMQ
jgi:hypothetical protein